MNRLRYALRSLKVKIFGDWCQIHDRHYRSDLCPHCVRERAIRAESRDTRPEWTKSEGTWPRRH